MPTGSKAQAAIERIRKRKRKEREEEERQEAADEVVEEEEYKEFVLEKISAVRRKEKDIEEKKQIDGMAAYSIIDGIFTEDEYKKAAGIRKLLVDVDEKKKWWEEYYRKEKEKKEEIAHVKERLKHYGGSYHLYWKAEKEEAYEKVLRDTQKRFLDEKKEKLALEGLDDKQIEDKILLERYDSYDALMEEKEVRKGYGYEDGIRCQAIDRAIEWHYADIRDGTAPPRPQRKTASKPKRKSASKPKPKSKTQENKVGDDGLTKQQRHEPKRLGRYKEYSALVKERDDKKTSDARKKEIDRIIDAEYPKEKVRHARRMETQRMRRAK